MRPFKERHPTMDTSKVIAVPVSSNQRRSQKASTKQQVALRLSRDVVAALRATGPGWTTLADELLRAGLKRRQNAEVQTVEA